MNDRFKDIVDNFCKNPITPEEYKDKLFKVLEDVYLSGYDSGYKAARKNI